MDAVLPGRPYPLGATWEGEGVNFALFTEQAQRVELCVFDSPDAKREARRIMLPECTHNIWDAHVTGVGPGQLYGYRVHGPYDPKAGHRFIPQKVLLAPMPKPSGARSGGQTSFSATSWATRSKTSPWTRETALRMRIQHLSRRRSGASTTASFATCAHRGGALGCARN